MNSPREHREPGGTAAGVQPPPLLDVRNMRVTYGVQKGGGVQAVRGVTFSVNAGESVGLVGESGSGKSSVARALMRLTPPGSRIDADVFQFDGRNLLTLDPTAMRKVRGREISMIFQDPLSSLNPVLTVGRQITETIQTHRKMSREQATVVAREMLERVGIPDPERRLRDYPFRLSGGMQQRIMVAIALVLNPRLLVADEPTTALDVTIQAQILELIRDVSMETSAATLLITHDLGIVAGMTQRTLVMYAGKIIESGSTDAVFASPTHPYTVGLLASVPRLDTPRQSRLRAIPGAPPAVGRVITGCPFAPRCDRATAICGTQDPPLVAMATNGPKNLVSTQSSVACWNPVGAKK